MQEFVNLLSLYPYFLSIEATFLICMLALICATLAIHKKIMRIESKIIIAADTQTETDFFDNVAHEVKTPITIILGNIQLLKSDSKLQDEKATYEEIKIAACRLENYLEELRDLKRIS